jgi:PKD repeat protein
MRSKTNTPKKEHRHSLSKLIKNASIVSLFAMATPGYAQVDSCMAYAYFTVATTDYKSLTITDHSFGGSLAYMWNFGDGTTSTAVNPGTHIYAGSGTHIITLQVTNAVGNCSSTYADTVSVPCTAGFSWTGNQHDISFKASIAMDPATTNYAWNFGDGTTSTLANPSHHYVNQGAYNPCLTVTSTLDSNCSDTQCGYLYIKDSDTTLTCSAAFKYYTYYAFAYSFRASQGDRNYLWDFGDGTTSTLQNPIHKFPQDQLYNVCLTVTNKTGTPCSDKFCNTVLVNTPKDCRSFFSIVADSITTDPYDFLILNQSSGLNLNYLWDFGDGTTSTLSNPTHDYAGTGPYVICLTVSNDSCKGIYCDTLDLSDTVHHLLPGKFHVTVVDKTTGIKKHDIHKATLSNYPNPFTGTTTITYSIFNSSGVELEVYNLLGVKVAAIEAGSKTPGNYTLEWGAQHLQEGIYLLQLKANDQLTTKKIIITK